MRTAEVTPEDRRAWWESVSRSCARLSLGRSDLEDYFQSALVEYYALPPGRREEIRDVAGWLATVARCRAIDDIRSRCARERAEVRFGVRCPAECPDVAESVTASSALWALLRQLPESTRRALVALSVGATAAEAASVAGMSRRAVESHLYRARRRLHLELPGTPGSRPLDPLSFPTAPARRGAREVARVAKGSRL